MTNSTPDRKAEITAAFRRHFTTRGYAGTVVSDVAAELSISKKTIYEHFDSKRQIWQIVVYNVAAAIYQRMAQELAAYRTYEQRLLRLLVMIFAGLRERQALVAPADNISLELQAFNEAYEDLLTALVREGIAAGEFSTVPIDSTVRFMQAILIEALAMQAADPASTAERDAVQAMIKLVT